VSHPNFLEDSQSNTPNNHRGGGGAWKNGISFSKKLPQDSGSHHLQLSEKKNWGSGFKQNNNDLFKSNSKHSSDHKIKGTSSINLGKHNPFLAASETHSNMSLIEHDDHQI
jgi:hypothetical protein